MNSELILGAHFSISKGYHRAVLRAHQLGCTALQIFTKNASTWKEREVSEDEIYRFRMAIHDTGIQAVFAHTSYLINLASSDPEIYRRSLEALAREFFRAERLGIPYLVLHPGFHKGSREADGIEQVAESICSTLIQTAGARVRLLLENTAGQGSSIGWSFEQLQEIVSRVSPRDRIGVCLDTGHMTAAGYDIRSRGAYGRTMRAFDRVVGLKHLCLLHLNDSARPVGSRVDRHAHIGEGAMGLEGFRLIMNDRRFAGVAKIIETPKLKNGADADHLNLERLRSLVAR
jgi:deoxyribonuclease-4